MMTLSTKLTKECFNTQPPEGGWAASRHGVARQRGFNTQPPEGGWDVAKFGGWQAVVSTHSRLKAAGTIVSSDRVTYNVVSTHSRLKAAGMLPVMTAVCSYGFNTQPPEGGWAYPMMAQL